MNRPLARRNPVASDLRRPLSPYAKKVMRDRTLYTRKAKHKGAPDAG
jgi:hypothetical protein